MEYGPMRMVFKCEGGNKLERLIAKNIIMDIYNKAAERMNAGLVDEYNKAWFAKHPEKDSVTTLEDEYIGGYDRLFKKTADEISEKIGTVGFAGRKVYLSDGESLTIKNDFSEFYVNCYIK